VRVPSVEQEDARHLHRELERLKRERLAHRVRMQSLLVTQGLTLGIKRGLGLRLDGLTLWDGRALPERLKAELERERERLGLVERQMQELEARRRERLKSLRTEAEQRSNSEIRRCDTGHLIAMHRHQHGDSAAQRIAAELTMHTLRSAAAASLCFHLLIITALFRFDRPVDSHW
jgi:hypothetical protein